MTLRSAVNSRLVDCLRVLIMAALFGIASISVMAASPEDYQKRIGTARVIVDELMSLDHLDKESAGYLKNDIAELRKLVPRNEGIEWPAGSIETNNVWLHDDLDTFVGETNIDKRDLILVRIEERLAAIAANVNELISSKSVGPSKDEEKQKLAEILRRQEFQKPAEKEESLFQKWRREFLEWLARMFPRIDLGPPTSTGLSSFSIILQFLLYAAIIAGIGYVLFRFMPFVSRRFVARIQKKGEDRVILGEKISGDESSAGLFAEAEDLARNGELRMAIRKGYIALLCDLADRKLIGLARHKTNRDYLRDVRSTRELFENVRSLTGSFESHWYGSQAPEENAWAEFREKYRQTIRSV